MRASLFRAFIAIAALLALAAPALPASKLSDRQVRQAQEFALNNSLFILYHEVAHLLFDQLNVPVLGKEEDAADNMAAYTMIKKHSTQSDAALADAAYGWLLYGKLYDGELDKEDFYNEHSLDSQRAYQIVCMMVGASPSTFGKIADDYEMDRDRQERCGRDYALVERSLDSVLNRYLGKNNGKGTKVNITYHAASGDLRKARDVFEKSGVFEQVADELKANYALSQPFSFRAKRCGEANAFYDPDAVEVIFCYEMMDELMALIAKDMPEDVAPPPRISTPGFGRAGTSGI